ncbi:hypothetical protein NQ318_013055 [Aromia moschata]|uniref:HAT C-terminal dimerisation domain-containing protein n=1 Tax=Aromia moschata TaxID=1265417 RepID=A0AAV8XMP4_9CUCU|nr:hypothetical protein NQ318_013055 [Aromia moschata]
MVKNKGLCDANSTLPLTESLLMVDEVNSLPQTTDDANEAVKNKLESVLKKGTNFTKLRHTYNGASTYLLSKCKEYFNYACITSASVEQSFSQYKRCNPFNHGKA